MPGDILFLPVNLKESSVAEKTKKFDNRNEINFLRGLEIYKVMKPSSWSTNPLECRFRAVLALKTV